ncbi:MAG: hypothetical protein D6802_12030 [Ardenticatenia bacterium]|nr:MAG: hypothetical protein D6802_12030 [Ardenticatenia bacterium]
MGELNAHRRTVGVAKVHNARQRRNLGVVPQAQIVFADAPARLNRCGFGDDQPTAANRPRAQVHQVPLGGAPVGSRRVHAHGRHDNAIAQRKTAQGIGRKQVRRHTL